MNPRHTPTYPSPSDSLTGRTHERHDWDAILAQDEIWVDARLREHAVDRMPEDYVANVLGFCRCHLFEESQNGLEETTLICKLRARLLAFRLAQPVSLGPRHVAAKPVSSHELEQAQPLGH
jgi:hypothetical protein